jgi:isopentenyl phosphate kinase
MLFDVTGGMKRKISESINIVNEGVPVYLINGFYPERMIDIINGSDFFGTSINMNEESI